MNDFQGILAMETKNATKRIIFSRPIPRFNFISGKSPVLYKLFVQRHISTVNVDYSVSSHKGTVFL